MRHSLSVLHLLPHSGGGVGTVLRALLGAGRKDGASSLSSIVCLDRLNEITRFRLNFLGIPWVDGIAMEENRGVLPALFEKADIVLVHWWNHPFLMRLLFQGLPPSRLMLWSHVNGFASPQAFFPELFELPDRFVFASKASLQCPVVRKLPEYLKSKLRVIRSSAGIPEGAVKPCEKNGPFRFGYVGTVEPAKMHPDFLRLCASAKMNTRCIVAGGPRHKELRAQANLRGIGDQFEILGPVNDPLLIFRRLHAFAYPLNPTHYGTGEQVLVEAMAYGAVPVVFDNPPEKALIRHEDTGLIANTAEEFSEAIRFLAHNPVERERLAEAGRRFVLDECDIKISVNHFQALYEEMLSLPKCQRRLDLPSFDGIADGSPFHLFLASCGSDDTRRFFQMIIESRACSLPQEFALPTRGTPQHYLHLLGDDPRLECICGAGKGQVGV